MHDSQDQMCEEKHQTNRPRQQQQQIGNINNQARRSTETH